MPMESRDGGGFERCLAERGEAGGGRSDGQRLSGHVSGTDRSLQGGSEPRSEMDVPAPGRIAPGRTGARTWRASPDEILALQGTVGNRTVARLVASGVDRTRSGTSPASPAPLAQRQTSGAAVQQVVDPEEPPRATGQPIHDYTTLPGDVQAKIGQGVYHQLVANKTNGPGVRVTLVGTYKILSRQGGAWAAIGRVEWVGTGNMRVWVSSAEDYKRLLQQHGFESKWYAANPEDLWGLRKTVDGVGLHVRGQSQNLVEIHFDLHPPKWYALLACGIGSWTRSVAA